MDLERADEIRMSWGIHLEHALPSLMKMFRTQIPESLLPESKEDIYAGINLYADALADEGQNEAADQMRSTLSFLAMYNDDGESLKAAASNFEDENFREVFYGNR